MPIVLYCERCAGREILMEMGVMPLDRKTICAICPLCGFAIKPIGIGSR